MTYDMLVIALDILGNKTGGDGVEPTFLLRGGHKVKGVFELYQHGGRAPNTPLVVTDGSLLSVFDPADIVGITLDMEAP